MTSDTNPKKPAVDAVAVEPSLEDVLVSRVFWELLSPLLILVGAKVVLVVERSVSTAVDKLDVGVEVDSLIVTLALEL